MGIFISLFFAFVGIVSNNAGSLIASSLFYIGGIIEINFKRLDVDVRIKKD